jgi:hypothetical protein
VKLLATCHPELVSGSYLHGEYLQALKDAEIKIYPFRVTWHNGFGTTGLHSSSLIREEVAEFLTPFLV